MKRILEFFQKYAAIGSKSAATLLKVAVMSRRPSPACGPKEEEIIIMGNGPSLRSNLDNDMDKLKRHPLLSVNFAPNTPEFAALRPHIHVLADGVFFAPSGNTNVEKMWENLAAVDWGMVLYVPAAQRKNTLLGRLPENITVKYFNLTPAAGARWLTRKLFDAGLAMPRPRNVLIPSIMSAIREGYSTIRLIGADHSWSKTLWVDDDNRVMSVQPHFYKDNDKELKRVEQVGAAMHLHQMYESLSIAFRSYFDIKDYAERRGITIINSTPASFIDAFPRAPL